MSDDSNILPFRGGQIEGGPDDGKYPLPWSADEAGRIHDARGQQVGAMARADLAQLTVRVVNAAVAFNQAEAERPS